MKNIFVICLMLITGLMQAQEFYFDCESPITVEFTETGGEQEGGYKFTETTPNGVVTLSRTIDFYDIKIVNGDYINPVFTDIISSQDITEYDDGDWVVPLLDSTYVQYNLTYRTPGGQTVTASFRGILQVGYGTLVYYKQIVN